MYDAHARMLRSQNPPLSHQDSSQFSHPSSANFKPIINDGHLKWFSFLFLIIQVSSYQFWIVLDVILWINKEDVLWLQVSVCQLVLVKNWNTKRQRKRRKIKCVSSKRTEEKDAIEQDPWLTSDCSDDLVGHVPDVVDIEGLKVIFLQKIIRAQA